MKKAFATLKPEFILSDDDKNFLTSLESNLPETKLKQKQIERISDIYYKHVANKIVWGWGGDMAELEQKEKWPSGPRVKRHEAQRMILGHLLTAEKELTTEQAAKKFYYALTCRESYTIVLQKIYQITN